MPNPELKDSLEKLHLELEETTDLDDDSRQQLQHLMEDIRIVLERDQDESEEEDDSLGDQINEAIQQYEISHPGLTAALQHALDILSGAGL
jgi:hypothetical protein